jgi:hypothetical protein
VLENRLENGAPIDVRRIQGACKTAFDAAVNAIRRLQGNIKNQRITSAVYDIVVVATAHCRQFEWFHLLQTAPVQFKQFPSDLFRGWTGDIESS